VVNWTGLINRGHGATTSMRGSDPRTLRQNQSTLFYPKNQPVTPTLLYLLCQMHNPEILLFFHVFKRAQSYTDLEACPRRARHRAYRAYLPSFRSLLLHGIVVRRVRVYKRPRPAAG
jgi:hypothetical protein